MASESFERLRERLWPNESRSNVWMVADGARDRKIYGALLDSYLNYSCLYQGEIAPELEVAAPYLVQLDPDDKYARQLIEKAWGNSWGVFLKCGSSLKTLRRHLRALLTVRGPNNQLLLFRYYDPRVLRVYLPTCREDELKIVFGPIERFWVEDKDPSGLLEFQFSGGRLLRESYFTTSATQAIDAK